MTWPRTVGAAWRQLRQPFDLLTEGSVQVGRERLIVNQ
jgi:hypothetical protein